MKEWRIRISKRSSVCFLLICALSIGICICIPASAVAEYPDKPITLLISFDPGSTTDIIARSLFGGAEKYLGVRLVPENKAGGGGAVALSLVANAKPDGYTICAAPTDSIVYGPLVQKVPFKPLKSFTPILGVSEAAHSALIVRSDSPWKTFNEFIDYAKKNPGKIKYSTSGVGTGMHAAMEYIASKEKIKWVHVPYKAAPAALMALVGGHVDACSAGVGYAPLAADGQIRVFATHGKNRSPQFPNVPTLKELGYDFVKETTHSIVGPAGLPAETLTKLEMAFSKGIETPEFKNTLQKLDCTVANYPSKEFGPYLKDLWVRSERMFKEAGLITEPATQPY
jgi:tripartite-type tricarboxylate transporter receptor subunit TctC